MEKGKRLSSISEERKCSERGSAEKRRKSSGSQERRKKDVKESPSTRGKQNKPSLIPVPKPEKIEPRSVLQKQRKCYSSTKLCCVTSTKGNHFGKCEDFNTKLKMLEEKEKSIAQYYRKVEDLIRKLTEAEQNPDGKTVKSKTSQGTEARKMTSEPSVLNRAKTNSEILSDLESNVRQISQIWREASNDLSNTLKNLRNNPSLDPMELELQKVRIQLAIKQTKSLTLIKTRDILAEAKMLFRHREMIRSELENVLNYDNLSMGNYAYKKDDVSLEDKVTSTSLKSENKKPIGGTGDSPKESDLESQDVNSNSNESSGKERELTSGTDEGSFFNSTSKSETSSSEEKAKNSDQTSMKQYKLETHRTSSHMTTNAETWAKEMSKKNETIANLNSKVFELQKTCNEQSQQCSQLQLTLSQATEKIQWNHVLRKQIGKLKEQIKGLQQSNKHLESQKRELECKITRLDLELDRLIKLNHFLNQRKYLLSAQECTDREYPTVDYREECSRSKCEKPDKESEKNMEERLLAEKQNAINQLKTILNVMKDQENFAQKQITVFQNKIEELEKNTKS